MAAGLKARSRFCQQAARIRDSRNSGESLGVMPMIHRLPMRTSRMWMICERIGGGTRSNGPALRLALTPQPR